MVTGVETAGLVLGAFPLCIELIKLYASGVATLNEMRNYRQVLREFERELKMEFCKFISSLCDLFEDKITEEDCNRFLGGAGGGGALEQRLKARLSRPQAASSFIDAVRTMNEELGVLRNAFASLDGSVAAKITRDVRVPVESIEYGKVQLSAYNPGPSTY